MNASETWRRVKTVTVVSKTGVAVSNTGHRQPTCLHRTPRHLFRHSTTLPSVLLDEDSRAAKARYDSVVFVLTISTIQIIVDDIGRRRNDTYVTGNDADDVIGWQYNWHKKTQSLINVTQNVLYGQ